MLLYGNVKEILKMKKRLLALLVLGTLISALQAESTVKEWTLTIVPGKSYSYIKWYGIYPMKKKPLIAVWLEDRSGRLLKTLYVTDRAAENRWRGGAEERPESLPVYYGSRDKAMVSEDIDVISAASKGKSPEARRFGDDFPSETAFIMAEVNISYDYNDYYTRNRSGVNGQPSLVYQAEWDKMRQSFSLVPTGTGSLSGDDCAVHTDMSHLSSALDLLSMITLSIQIH